jgi:phosphoribosylanthranilate isomerase
MARLGGCCFEVQKRVRVFVLRLDHKTHQGKGGKGRKLCDVRQPCLIQIGNQLLLAGELAKVNIQVNHYTATLRFSPTILLLLHGQVLQFP